MGLLPPAAWPMADWVASDRADALRSGRRRHGCVGVGVGVGVKVRRRGVEETRGGGNGAWESEGAMCRYPCMVRCAEHQA